MDFNRRFLSDFNMKILMYECKNKFVCRRNQYSNIVGCNRKKQIQTKFGLEQDVDELIAASYSCALLDMNMMSSLLLLL